MNHPYKRDLNLFLQQSIVGLLGSLAVVRLGSGELLHLVRRFKEVQLLVLCEASPSLTIFVRRLHSDL